MAFHKVALLGKGLLGSAVVEQLAENGFEVAVLTRDPSAVTGLPTGVKAVKVDYESHDSLVAALKNQDAAVATVGSAGILGQKKIIDASISAGVQRYIPSDWGSITTDPEGRQLPIFAPMVQIQDYLKKKADEGVIEYTIFSVGAFLDFVLDAAFFLDVQNHTIQVSGSGEHPFSCTSVAGIGRAVAGALQNPAATKNRNLFVHEAVLTQAKILALARKHSPPGVTWTETHVDAKQAFDDTLAAVLNNPEDPNLLHPLFKAAVLNGQYRTAYPKVDNAVVGLPLLSDAEVEARFATKFMA